ncbi:MAG TPA: acireductone dioxygenase [Gammaproteobacteria bacterium]|nr:acireductone dioxygenase [Gammaproteobacteria bacterium]
MSRLTIYADDYSGKPEVLTNHAEIARRLRKVGVQFERWLADKVLPVDADQETVLKAYKTSVDRLNREYGFKSIDVVSLRPDHPKKDEMRQKFLNEHTHDDFEVRFFVDGSGLFYLHIDDKVYMVLCEQGDLISVPAKVTHWFDMGAQPNFKCIRFFVVPEGWVGNFTGSDIARRFPDFDRHAAASA